MTSPDAYLSLRALSVYAGLSVRTLRARLTSATDPLPYYRIGGSIRVRRSEYDAWVQRFKRSEESAERTVTELLAGM